MGAAGVFDDGKQHAAHIGEQHAPLAQVARPLDLHGIGAVVALGGIVRIPCEDGDTGRRRCVDDTQGLAAPNEFRPVPAAGNGFFVTDALLGNGRAIACGGRREMARRDAIASLLERFIAGAIGSDCRLCVGLRFGTRRAHGAIPVLAGSSRSSSDSGCGSARPDLKASSAVGSRFGQISRSLVIVAP